MTDPRIQEIVDNSTLRTMDWKSVTYGSLIYTDSKWYLFLDSNHMIRVEKGYNWSSQHIGNVDSVQCICDRQNNPISFFYELQSMLLELVNTGRTPR